MRKFTSRRRPPFARKPNDDRKDAQHPTSWDHVAEWYGGYLSQKDTVQRDIVFPGALRLLGVGKGKTFLDIACGEGSFAQMISRQGGDVVGFDAAPALVRRAQMKNAKGAEFVVADAERFAERLGGKKFDGASCILAIQNIKNMQSVFDNAARVMKRDGSLVVVLNHPAFRIPRQTSWGFEEERKLMYRRVDSYMTENAIPIAMHPGEAPSMKTLSFHRPLSAYIAALAKAGFVVDAIEEWVSNKTSDSGSRAKAENRSRAEIPLFMAVRAKKR